MQQRDLPDPAALIFDLDGTLVDTVDLRIEAWLRALREIDVAVERAALGKLIGSDGKRLAREVAAAAGRELDGAEAERIDARSGDLYDGLNRDPKPLPGARELLAELTELGCAWAVATSSRPGQVRASINALGLSLPPRLVDGSHVERAKPAPDLLLAAARQLGVAPERCWYVGDATWDMLAATAARMPSVGVATGAVAGAALRDSGAWLVVGSLVSLQDELRLRRRRSGPCAPR